MGVLGRLLGSRQRRRDAERARQIIEAAFLKSREPKTCAEAAASGADTRDRLLIVVDEIEKETGDLSIVFAADATLIDPRLIQMLERRPDGELLRLAIDSCFINPNAVQYVNEQWPATVERHQSRPNTDELIREKATILTAYVVHNLGAGVEVAKDVLKDSRGINEDQELSVKLEEACLWYRLIDELAYIHIPGDRSRFMDFFEEDLAHLLALLGAEPGTICTTLSARSEEYGPYREWVSGDPDKMAGTLFWNAAKRVGAPIGFERHFLFTQMFGTLFLDRVERALIRELLTGNSEVAPERTT
jgi:hypothetical protein